MGSSPEGRPSAPGDENDNDACCSCDCQRRCRRPLTWRRSVKRKLDEVEGARGGLLHADVAARVEADDEAVALREALASHQQTVSELWTELEQERAASATAASETMSMILRLQREKAEAQMEARQFKRFAEEKMAHDQQELVALDDLLYKREQALQALSCELQAYRHRLLGAGIAVDEIGPSDSEVDPKLPPADNGAVITPAETPTYEYQPAFEYPQLRCHSSRLDPETDDDDVGDLHLYPPGGTPRGGQQQLQTLERRIHHLERSQSRCSLVLEMDKGVVVGQSSPRPVRAKHARQFSLDSFNSPLAMESPCNRKQRCEFPASFGRQFDDGGTVDRVYTVDAVHQGASMATRVPTARPCDEYLGTPREAVCCVDRGGGGGGGEEAEMKKLYMRLEALEADRESMKQALLSMRTDKAQLVLLKEIAQQLYKDASSSPATLSDRRFLKRPSPRGRVSFMSLIKWVFSLIFWRGKTRRSKLPSGGTGLLLLLEKAPLARQWRCPSRIR